MDQEKIGKFIAECRKKQNLTQEELAEKLGVTNKSISRWENGKTMPDYSIITNLCEELKISINEFFAGQYLDKSELTENSEKNILNIAREENRTRKKLKKVVIAFMIVIMLLIISMIGLYKYMCSFMSVSKTFELNWGIILPNDFKEEYYTDTGASFHGDGIRYSVFEGNNFMTSLKEEKDEKLENEISELYISLNTPKEYQIDFSHKYIWTKVIQKDDERNYIYCIFDEEISKFYFYEFLV